LIQRPLIGFYNKLIITYRAFHTEHMTIVFARLYVSCDVGKEVEVVSVLACTEYIPYLMVAYHLL